MKLNKFLLSAIAAASLTACSDSTDVVDSNKGHWNADGTGYVSLSISMPDNVGSKGSRATTNDTFVKGDDKEYVVNNATLVIFSGNKKDSEGAYTMEAAYNLPLKFQTTGNDNQQIISTAKITQKINQIGKAYAKALVILNLPSKLKLEDNDLKYDGTSYIGKTFTEFQALKSELEVDVAKGFTMTNAPLTTGKSGATVPSSSATTTLATINKENIKPTAEEAEQNTAATIYVERSVAKVTVTKSSTASDKIEGTTNIKYSIKGFDLDNTNTTSFIVRNADETAATWYKLKSNSNLVNGDDKYRFIGVSSVNGTPAEGNSLYRTYWAKDPNYDNTTTAINSSTSTDDKRFSAAPQYCMENTFDVAHQTQVNTTRAILRVQMYKDGETAGTTYYMYNNDVNTFDSETDFNTNAVTTANKLTAVLAGGKKVASIALEDAKDESGNKIAGYKQIQSVTFEGETSSKTAGDAFIAIKNYFGKITVYTDGYAYYPVLIKHFGDQLTPWNIEGTGKEWSTTQPSTNNIYPSTDEERDANYLGRYGVVRNNWYELSVNKVLRPGSPVINSPSTNPDDELNSYISVSINILSWAKRSQDVDLQ
jgi:hypothetical protein